MKNLLLIGAVAVCSCNMPQPGSPSPAASDTALVAAADTAAVMTADVDYDDRGTTLKGYAAWPANATGKLPVVMVIHEWWGQTEYPRRRARELANLGYYAFAVDMYGDRKQAEAPDSAEKLSMPFYSGVDLARARFVAALDKIKTIPEADANNVAVIGYCFGGALAINMARDGQPIKGVVSFHGNLIGNPAVKGKSTNAKYMVLHGGDDKFVPDTEVAAFKKQMDSVGAKLTFITYPGATHAFTNSTVDEKAKKYNMPVKYDANADRNSWEAMKGFLKEVLGR